MHIWGIWGAWGSQTNTELPIFPLFVTSMCSNCLFPLAAHPQPHSNTNKLPLQCSTAGSTCYWYEGHMMEEAVSAPTMTERVQAVWSIDGTVALFFICLSVCTRMCESVSKYVCVPRSELYLITLKQNHQDIMKHRGLNTSTLHTHTQSPWNLWYSSSSISFHFS